MSVQIVFGSEFTILQLDIIEKFAFSFVIVFTHRCC